MTYIQREHSEFILPGSGSCPNNYNISREYQFQAMDADGERFIKESINHTSQNIRMEGVEIFRSQGLLPAVRASNFLDPQ